MVADGFKIPAAVNFDSKGNLFVVDTALGQLVQGRSQDRRQEGRRAAQAVARQPRDRRQGPHLRLQHGRQRHSGSRSRDRRAKQIIIGKLALPGGIAVVSDGAKDTIYVADVFAYRTVDGATGEVSEPAACMPTA